MHLSLTSLDEDLVNGARAGNDEAFTVLVVRHQTDIYRLALRFAGESK